MALPVWIAHETESGWNLPYCLLCTATATPEHLSSRKHIRCAQHFDLDPWDLTPARRLVPGAVAVPRINFSYQPPQPPAQPPEPPVPPPPDLADDICNIRMSLTEMSVQLSHIERLLQVLARGSRTSSHGGSGSFDLVAGDGVIAGSTSAGDSAGDSAGGEIGWSEE